MQVAYRGYGTYRVALPSEALPRKATFDVTLSARNFLGKKDSTTVRLTKLGVPAPTIRIAGAKTRTDATFSSALKLRAVASLPTMSCIDSNLANAKMSFKWKELTGQLSDEDVQSFVTKSPTILAVPAETLEAQVTTSSDAMAGSDNAASRARLTEDNE